MADGVDIVKGRLENVAAVTALVPATRMYASIIPQSQTTFPCIRLSVVSGISHKHMEAITGLAQQRIQVDVVAKLRSSAVAAMEEVRLALDMFTGTIDTTAVRRIISQGDYRYTAFEPKAGENDWKHVASRDFMVTFLEATS